MRIFQIYFVALTALLLPVLSAQNFATVTGSVTDKSGASAAATKVTATNIVTQVARETLSDDSGNYTIPLLPPGRYRVAASKEGFRQSVQDNVTL